MGKHIETTQCCFDKKNRIEEKRRQTESNRIDDNNKHQVEWSENGAHN